MRQSEAIPVQWGAFQRSETGWSENPNRCMMIELGEDVVSPFSYLQADNASTPFARYRLPLGSSHGQLARSFDAQLFVLLL